MSIKFLKKGQINNVEGKFSMKYEARKTMEYQSETFRGDF